MIQRIQSVYLLLSAIASGAVIMFFPLFSAETADYYLLDDPVFTVMAVLSTIISLFSIFRYKNRRQQLVSGRINIIINFVLFGLIFYLFYNGHSEAGAALRLGSFIPLICVVLITLANKGIMKDEMTVRSADRLR